MRPHDEPIDLRLHVDGIPFDEVLLRALAEVRLEQRWNEPARLSLRMRELAEAEAKEVFAWTRDAEITLSLGAEFLFRGLFTGCRWHCHPASGRCLDLFAKDPLIALARTTAPRAVMNKRLSEHLAERLPNLALKVHQDSPVIASLLQLGCDDLSALQRLAARYGLGFQLHSDRLQVFGDEGYGDPIALIPGVHLIAHQYERDDERPMSHAVAEGWLLGEGQLMIDFSGDEGPEGQLFVSAPGEDQDSMSGRSMGALAEVQSERSVLSFEAFGQSDLVPGRRVSFEPWPGGPTMAGLLREVTHSITAERGFVTKATTALPARARFRPQPMVARVGTVFDAEDPERRGRVRVRLVEEIETDWLPVASAVASRGAGVVAIPSRSDVVLVYFTDPDLGRGLVLGSLYAAEGFPEGLAASGEDIRRLDLLTRGGQKICVDDAAGSIELTAEDGSRLTLGGNRTVLHSAKHLVLEAPGQTLTLRAQRIDMEQA